MALTPHADLRPANPAFWVREPDACKRYLLSLTLDCMLCTVSWGSGAGGRGSD